MGPYLQVEDEWEIVQTNGYRVQINIKQDKEFLSAFASHSNLIEKSPHYFIGGFYFLLQYRRRCFF
ncbi:hypothetical protein IIG_05003 [Bacillus cereus VD048]|uniref:Uncharacterized protein n=1 Tax=Bacillus cereus VD048 TaxID=1053226 RepID=J8HHL6_BACCE|nr:hypothetical protein IIG_05003 [Bacillus cereus VD048]